VTSGTRDPSTISPSAKGLLLVKSQSSLPFAREAAELLWGVDAVEAARRAEQTEEGAVLRRRHFELRAESIDRALAEVAATRVLELAAGLSFRGLAMAARRADVSYLDTDLPNIVDLKSDLVPRLHPAPLAGVLRVLALDALDAPAFAAAVRELPDGPIAVVHEGLLMYLDDGEKDRLAANVAEALGARGGWWITADVYVRSDAHVFRDERTKRFLEQHSVEDKKFASWEAAEAFFSRGGFRVARRAPSTGDPQHARETWTLALK